MEKAATAATYTGAGTAVFFGLTANEFAAVGGLVRMRISRLTLSILC